MIIIHRSVVAVVIGFLFLPIVFVVVSSFGATAMMAFPPTAFTLDWYKLIPAAFASSLRISLVAACLTAMIATVTGTGIALAVARGRFPGARALAIFSLSPLMVPALVIAVGLFQFTGLFWDLTGIDFVGTLTGIVLGHSVCATPYIVRSVLAGHSHFDHSFEEAALNLGAGRLRTLWSVTLPVLFPSIATGALFGFLISFDDLPIALFMAGGEDTTTLPVRIYSSIEYSLKPDVMAISSLIIYASLAFVVVLDRFIGIERLLANNRS